jgi:hypothetical protein
MRLLEFFRPFRIVVSRRVSEEEQVSVEMFCKTINEANVYGSEILSMMRDHRKKSNEEVVAATRQQMAALDTTIENKERAIQRATEELRHVEELLAKKRTKLNPPTSIRPNGPLA